LDGLNLDKLKAEGLPDNTIDKIEAGFLKPYNNVAENAIRVVREDATATGPWYRLANGISQDPSAYRSSYIAKDATFIRSSPPSSIISALTETAP
jgi:hypothetical protein